MQLDTDYVRKLKGRKVIDVLKQCDDRGQLEDLTARLELTHVLTREVQQLSGGELQRFAPLVDEAAVRPERGDEELELVVVAVGRRRTREGGALLEGGRDRLPVGVARRMDSFYHGDLTPGTRRLRRW